MNASPHALYASGSTNPYPHRPSTPDLQVTYLLATAARVLVGGGYRIDGEFVAAGQAFMDALLDAEQAGDGQSYAITDAVRAAAARLEDDFERLRGSVSFTLVAGLLSAVVLKEYREEQAGKKDVAT